MNKTITLIAVVVFVAIAAIFILSRSSPISQPSTQKEDKTTTDIQVFKGPKKSAHYESSTPTHGAILASVPINVVIDFNFDLTKPSSVSITKDGQEYGVGETIIDSNKLSMRRNVDPNAPDGRYTVNYNSCWPDKSCHDGNFQLEIKRSYIEQYEDMRSKPEVTIRLSETQFQPKLIRVSKGTKLVWINDDTVEHYVNTDSHPAHTYYKEQNSKALKKGDAYTLFLKTPGEYPYHCSAHADSMMGSIVVE